MRGLTIFPTYKPRHIIRLNTNLTLYVDSGLRSNLRPESFKKRAIFAESEDPIVAGTDVTGTWLADDDAELLKEGLRGGIMSTEAAVEDRLVLGAAS